MNSYSYHYKQLSNLNGCCHNWFDPPKYGIMCIVHNCICNNNCHWRKNMIIHWTHIRKQLHSPCHIILWLFILILIYFYLLFSGCYSTLLMVLFSSYNGYFLLLTMCVHKPLVCVGHCDFSMCYYAWETFIILSQTYISWLNNANYAKFVHS